MSLPSYILNWEELLVILGDKLEIDINDIDLGDLENYLGEQFEIIIDLLKQILDLLKDKGVQRIHSISNHIPAVVAPFKFTTTFDEDVLITGITYSQSAWKYQDSWDLEIDGNILFEEVGTKEIGESKQNNVFYYVPAGKAINIIFHNDSGNSRLVWFDIEYIGLSMNNYIPLPKPTGTIVVNYITEDGVLTDSTVLADVKYGLHIIKPKYIPGYTLVHPDRHAVKLSDEEPIVTVEFIIKKEVIEPPIDPPIDPPVIDPEDPKPPIDTKCLTLKKIQIRVEPWNHPEGVFDLIDIEVKDFGEFLLFGTEIGYVFNAKVNIDEDGDFNSTFKHYGLNDNHVEDYSRSFCVMEVKYICNEGTFIKKHHAVVTEASVAEIKENAYEELPFCKQV